MHVTIWFRALANGAAVVDRLIDLFLESNGGEF